MAVVREALERAYWYKTSFKEVKVERKLTAEAARLCLLAENKVPLDGTLLARAAPIAPALRDPPGLDEAASFTWKEWGSVGMAASTTQGGSGAGCMQAKF